MIRRFCLYAILRNLRLFDAFFVLFLLLELNLSYTVVGLVLAYEKIILGLFEIPLAVVSDRLGRRRALMASFSLASMAFCIFGLSLQCDAPMAMIFLGQTIYGIAESLRTGTHKAIVLDWLSINQMSHRRVEVLGQMRFFSKTSAGLAALLAGILVWATGDISILFWAATIPTLLGVVLLAQYPSMTEGNIERRSQRGVRENNPSLRQALTAGGIWTLMVPSVLFESQTKLAIAYLQPAIAEGGKGFGLLVLGGVGALLVGGYMALNGFLAGSASLASNRLVTWSKGVHGALRKTHILAASIMTAACVGFYLGHAWLGLVFMLGLGALQNTRRPIFLTAMDDVMDPHYRATTLSVESQGRSWVYAGTSVGSGWIADTLGLTVAFALMAVLLWVAAGLSGRSQAK
jgi:MFS family permease